MVFSSARKNNFRRLEIFFRYNSNVKELFSKSAMEEKCVADGNQKTNYLEASANSCPLCQAVFHNFFLNNSSPYHIF